MSKHIDEMLDLMADVCTLPRRAVQDEMVDTLNGYTPPPTWSDDRPIFTVERRGPREQQESSELCREAHELYGDKGGRG